MELGKIYKARPEFLPGEWVRGANGRVKVKPKLKGKCVWIHPRGRFAVLEFSFRGGTVRECFRAEELE